MAPSCGLAAPDPARRGADPGDGVVSRRVPFGRSGPPEHGPRRLSLASRGISPSFRAGDHRPVPGVRAAWVDGVVVAGAGAAGARAQHAAGLRARARGAGHAPGRGPGGRGHVRGGRRGVRGAGLVVRHRVCPRAAVAAAGRAGGSARAAGPSRPAGHGAGGAASGGGVRLGLGRAPGPAGGDRPPGGAVPASGPAPAPGGSDPAAVRRELGPDGGIEVGSRVPAGHAVHSRDGRARPAAGGRGAADPFAAQRSPALFPVGLGRPGGARALDGAGLGGHPAARRPDGAGALPRGPAAGVPVRQPAIALRLRGRAVPGGGGRGRSPADSTAPGRRCRRAAAGCPCRLRGPALATLARRVPRGRRSAAGRARPAGSARHRAGAGQPAGQLRAALAGLAPVPLAQRPLGVRTGSDARQHAGQPVGLAGGAHSGAAARARPGRLSRHADLRDHGPAAGGLARVPAESRRCWRARQARQRS